MKHDWKFSSIMVLTDLVFVGKFPSVFHSQMLFDEYLDSLAPNYLDNISDLIIYYKCSKCLIEGKYNSNDKLVIKRHFSLDKPPKEIYEEIECPYSCEESLFKNLII